MAVCLCLYGTSIFHPNVSIQRLNNFAKYMQYTRRHTFPALTQLQNGEIKHKIPPLAHTHTHTLIWLAIVYSRISIQVQWNTLDLINFRKQPKYSEIGFG